MPRDKTRDAGRSTNPVARAANGAKPTGFDPQLFLTTAAAGRSSASHRKGAIVFRQDDPADSVFYILKGEVRITVVSERGEDGVVARLGPGHFFGEGCLSGQPLRLATATAAVAASVLRIDKAEMIRVLHDEPAFSELFVAYVLSHNVESEARLIDQLFTSRERRLARLLLLVAHFGKEGRTERVIPKVSLAMLASRVGAPVASIEVFMDKFRKLGFIEYDAGTGTLKVNFALLSVVVHD